MIGNFQTDTLLCCVPPPSFRFRETVALTALVLPAFVSEKAVALIAPSFRRLLLLFDLESVLDLRFWWSFGRAFSLILGEDVVDLRWISDDCIDGGCIPVMWWGFDLRTCAPLMVFRSRRGGRMTRVPRCEDLDTCPVHATRVNEEAPLGLG
ncbi:hypothetical protein F2Q68_00012665 [Brassica cretica]|uniref:Uncharacterized protein n=1 Tax=Brassica cretica TaxID=69181 RepID=A0A8S9HMR4_BRACR|nr:hypothetical protein F2Q68_00012665 [Brassica cretica]